MSTLRLPTCTLDLDRQRLVRADSDERLSKRETELLAYLAARAGDLVTRQELEREVWGFADGVRSEAVPVAVRRLRARIEVDPRNPRILLTEYGRGWKLVLESPVDAVPPARSLFGRAAALASIASGWGESHLQVIVGPGGVGKTTLARAACPEGALIVDLAQAVTGPQCLEAIRCKLPGMQLDGVEEAEALARIHLRLAELPLTVLDNAEQVVEPLADLVAQLGNARLLVTSRLRLGVPGERVVRLDPLELADASVLFCERYRLAGGRAELDPAGVARVVQLLDRLPLAIELLAPRARVLPLDKLAERLERGLSAIPSARGRPPRHSSMRNCLEWSWQALDPASQDALRAAITFATPFSFDDLEQVFGSDPIEPLDRLIEGSLVVNEEPGLYSVRVLVRAFVADQPGDAHFAERHAGLFLQRLAEVPHGIERLRQLLRLAPELQRVVDQATREDHVFTAALGVHQALLGGGLAFVSQEVLATAIERTSDPQRCAELTLAMAEATSVVDSAQAQIWLAAVEVEALRDPSAYYTVCIKFAMHGALEAPPLEAHIAAVESHPSSASLTALALAWWVRGDFEQSEVLIRRAARLARQGPDLHARVYTLRIFNMVVSEYRQTEEAEAALREALRLAEAISMKSEIVRCRGSLAVKFAARDRVAAAEVFAQVEREHHALGDVKRAEHSRANRAVNAWFLGDPATAWALFDSIDFAYIRPAVRRYFEMFREAAGFELGLVPAEDLREVLKAYGALGTVHARTLAMLLGARLLAWPLEIPLQDLAERSFSADITSCVAWLREQAPA